ncbi:MAG: hypothetical protein J3K34DRAFT_408907 [Monoraphidium minutum]|nr:MAG: hypothetical protein J3K34DRAFT_408907 [Monoraphidium minutum]
MRARRVGRRASARRDARAGVQQQGAAGGGPGARAACAGMARAAAGASRRRGPLRRVSGVGLQRAGGRCLPRGAQRCSKTLGGCAAARGARAPAPRPRPANPVDYLQARAVEGQTAHLFRVGSRVQGGFGACVVRPLLLYLRQRRAPLPQRTCAPGRPFSRVGGAPHRGLTHKPQVLGLGDCCGPLPACA